MTDGQHHLCSSFVRWTAFCSEPWEVSGLWQEGKAIAQASRKPNGTWPFPRTSPGIGKKAGTLSSLGWEWSWLTKLCGDGRVNRPFLLHWSLNQDPGASAACFLKWLGRPSLKFPNCRSSLMLSSWIFWVKCWQAFFSCMTWIYLLTFFYPISLP